MRLSALVVVGTVLAGAGCSRDTSLARLTETRRLSADLLVQLTMAADASNRAVMADTEATARSLAEEAARTSRAVQRDVDALAPLLQALQYTDESRLLDEFRARFDQYRALDRRILDLAVEGTNLRAQRLSFGAGHDAATAVRDALSRVTPRDAAVDRWRVEALVSTAVMHVWEIQALHAPHIAQADHAAMTGLESQIATAATGARTALGGLAPLIGAASRPGLDAAVTAFDRFMAINDEILALSRRNTNVQSVALSLNQKRLITGASQDSLTAITAALAKRGFTATR